MLLVLFGPPSVGKMTVGRALAAASDFRLFHNHMTIEPLLEVFGHGTAPFTLLNDEFRIRVIEEAARAGLDLVFTVVWDLRDPADAEIVTRYVEAYGEEVAFVELRAGLETRLERNRTEERLTHKTSKRDLEWSDGNVRAMEAHTMTSVDGLHAAEDLLTGHPHLVLDTEGRSVAESAAAVLAWLCTSR